MRIPFLIVLVFSFCFSWYNLEKTHRSFEFEIQRLKVCFFTDSKETFEIRNLNSINKNNKTSIHSKSIVFNLKINQKLSNTILFEDIQLVKGFKIESTTKNRNEFEYFGIKNKGLRKSFNIQNNQRFCI